MAKVIIMMVTRHEYIVGIYFSIIPPWRAGGGRNGEGPMDKGGESSFSGGKGGVPGEGGPDSDPLLR